METTTRTVSTRSWVSIPLPQLQECARLIEARIADGSTLDADYDTDVLVDLRIEIADRLRAIARGQDEDMTLERKLHQRNGGRDPQGVL